MSENNINLASAINLSENRAVLLTAKDLAAILTEIKSLREEFELFREEAGLERARDRKRITALESIEPQPKQKDRGELLKALLVANGGKMFAKDARQKMGLPKNLFSMLLKSQANSIKVRPFHLDKMRMILEIL